MAKRKELDIDLTNDDADGLADGVDSTGSSVALTGALTSGGTWTASDVGIARIIEIKDSSTVDQSGATFTITGTSEAGVIGDTEAIVGPASGATVKSAKAWYYISSIAIASPAVACTVDVGPANETLSGRKIIPINYKPAGAARISVDVTGTINFTVQETYDDRTALTTAVWTDITALADKTADTTSVAAAHVTALRIEVNSYSDGAEMQVVIIQDNPT